MKRKWKLQVTSRIEINGPSECTSNNFLFFSYDHEGTFLRSEIYFRNLSRICYFAVKIFCICELSIQEYKIAVNVVRV